MSVSLCDLSQRLPVLVGTLLDRENLLRRGRFREETMTDILTGSLAAFAGPSLVIEYPPEATTGGDIDLQFWHVDSGRNLLLRIQAKRLNAQKHGTRQVKIEHRSYRELLHKSPSATDYQYKTLTTPGGASLPLYMFYNHQSVADDPFFATPGPKVSGINLAFASDIAKELDEKLEANSGTPRERKHHKRLSHLRQHLFGLETILCPPGDLKGEEVPPPELVAAALHQAWKRHSDETEGASDVDLVYRALVRPDELLTSRSLIQLISSGPAVRASRERKRPTITFISGRTDDSRTPSITSQSPAPA